MQSVCLVGMVLKPRIQMAAPAVTAVTLASLAPQQKEFPAVTRTRDCASVNPMSQVNRTLDKTTFFLRVVISEIFVLGFHFDIFDGEVANAFALHFSETIVC